MKRFIVHPRRKLIIRSNPIRGMEDMMCMDRITDDFRHDSEMTAESDVTDIELLEKYRGTGKGRASIPDDGWVSVEVEEETPMKEIFEKGAKLKHDKKFI